MTNTSTDALSTLLAQRAELEEQIETLRIEARADALNKVRELIQNFGLSEDEVFGRKGKRGRNAGKTSTPLPPKYRNPETNETWSGKGRSPAWLKDKDRSQFLI